MLEALYFHNCHFVVVGQRGDGDDDDDDNEYEDRTERVISDDGS